MKERGRKIILNRFTLSTSVRGRLAQTFRALLSLQIGGSILLLRYKEMGCCIRIPKYQKVESIFKG